MFIPFLFLFFLLWCIVQTPFLMLSVYWLRPKSIALFHAFRLTLLSQSLAMFFYFLLGLAVNKNLVNLPGVALNYGWIVLMFAVCGLCYGIIPLSAEDGPSGLVWGFKIASVQFVLFLLLVVGPLACLSALFG